MHSTSGKHYPEEFTDTHGVRKLGCVCGADWPCRDFDKNTPNEKTMTELNTSEPSVHQECLSTSDDTVYSIPIPTPLVEAHIDERCAEGALGVGYEFARELERMAIVAKHELKCAKSELEKAKQQIHDLEVLLSGYETALTEALSTI